MDAPITVPLDKEYAPSGNGVVSYRNMAHVGYNGIQFRKLKACPELHNVNDPIVKEAWPVGLLRLSQNSPASGSEEPVYGSEYVKCAPENWVVRRPVAHFNKPGEVIKSRYPPRNMVNAKYKKPPRNPDPWTPTAT